MLGSIKRVAVLGLVSSATLLLAGSSASAFLPPPALDSFCEDFETGLPSGTLTNQAAPGELISLASGNWHAVNLSAPIGSTGVFESGGPSAPFLAQEGDFNAAMNFRNGSGTSDINAFFMSPVVTFDNGDSIKFWTRTVPQSSFADRLHVVFSVAGPSVDAIDFPAVNRVLTINPELFASGYPGEWTMYVINVDWAPTTLEGRFAFNYEVPNGGPLGENSNFIGIDSVCYHTAVIPEPAAVGVLAPAALVLARRRR